jgi:hypothetical protein
MADERKALGWCWVHGCCHRNFVCWVGAGVPAKGIAPPEVPDNLRLEAVALAYAELMFPLATDLVPHMSDAREKARWWLAMYDAAMRFPTPASEALDP